DAPVSSTTDASVLLGLVRDRSLAGHSAGACTNDQGLVGTNHNTDGVVSGPAYLGLRWPSPPDTARLDWHRSRTHLDHCGASGRCRQCKRLRLHAASSSRTPPL